MNYNDNHPELKEDEYFYMNVPKTRKAVVVEWIKKYFPFMKFRLGRKAYSPGGGEVKKSVPMFRKYV